MLDRDEHPHSLPSPIAAVIAIAGTLCFVVSGSSAAGQAVVPDVVGLDVLSAYDAVRDAGFAVQIDEPIDVTPNTMARVSGQSRASATTGRPGSPIVLSLQPGPHGLLPIGGTQRMPRVVGRPLPDAVDKLHSLGLMWSAAPLPPLPATMRPTLLANYRVTEQRPKAGRRFTQSVVRELADGTVLTKTWTVGLTAELRPNGRRP
jgi:hypothetical protein